MIPASSTPPITAKIVFLKLRSRNDAASVPVHAPVPGRGMPTKNNRPIYALLEFWSFLPAFSPFFKHQLQNLFSGFHFFLAPHSRNLRENRKMNGTGIILPMMAMMSVSHSGRPRPTPIGTAPRSSISGTIDTKNTITKCRILI